MNDSNEYSLESVFRIYTSADDSYIEVGADGDGLRLVEIRMMNSKNVVEKYMTFEKECAKLLIKALTEYVEKME
jgi:hypothetical protein